MTKLREWRESVIEWSEMRETVVLPLTPGWRAVACGLEDPGLMGWRRACRYCGRARLGRVVSPGLGPWASNDSRQGCTCHRLLARCRAGAPLPVIMTPRGPCERRAGPLG